MKLQLIDDDDELVISTYELGTEEGEWNIHNKDEAGELLVTIARQVPYPTRCECDIENEDQSTTEHMDDCPLQKKED